jgi:hypothetical protein
MLDQPRPQSSAHLRGFGTLFYHGEVLADGKGWLDVLEELDREGVVFIDIADIGEKASFGV